VQPNASFTSRMLPNKELKLDHDNSTWTNSARTVAVWHTLRSKQNTAALSAINKHHSTSAAVSFARSHIQTHSIRHKAIQWELGESAEYNFWDRQTQCCHSVTQQISAVDGSQTSAWRTTYECLSTLCNGNDTICVYEGRSITNENQCIRLKKIHTL